LGSITVLSGGFGSGKTEIAINMALDTAEKVNNVILADLDLVNPYFASRDAKKYLDERGVRLLAPKGELSLGDLPSVPPEIMGFVKQNNNLIIDLAGDEVGALVLGYISNIVRHRNNMEFLMVINPYRPFASQLSDLAELKALLEGAAHLNFTGIVSNPNLVEETDIDVIINGHRKVEQYADKLKIPIRCLAVQEKFFAQLVPTYGKKLKKLKLFLRPHWL
jgi:Mrp family chromosome partitioning ATPase